MSRLHASDGFGYWVRRLELGRGWDVIGLSGTGEDHFPSWCYGPSGRWMGDIFFYIFVVAVGGKQGSPCLEAERLH